MLKAVDVFKPPVSEVINQELLTQVQTLKNQLKQLNEPVKQLFNELEEFAIVFLYFDLDSFPEEMVQEFQEIFKQVIHLVTPALIASSVLVPQLQDLTQRMNATHATH